MQFRDRIRELRRVRAKTLRPNPRNWRRHPEAQRSALKAILSEVGYADALLVRELPDGELELIDGHLRAETTPDSHVPVLVLDVSEAEADKLLALLDPLAAMAETDTAKLTDLVSQIQTDDASLQQALERLFQPEPPPMTSGKTAPPETDRAEIPDIPIPESYQVLVECRDEADQRTVYERLTGEGYACRVLTI